MPTYEYSCEKCGKTFETFQSMRDEPLRVCPKELCRQKKWGHGKVKRLIGRGAGLIFKGSGFYRTDSRNGSGSGEAKDKPDAKDKQVNGSGDGSSGKAADSGSSSSDKSGSGESKPAKKAEKAGSSGTGSKVA